MPRSSPSTSPAYRACVSSEYVTGPYDVVVRVSADTAGRLQTDVVPMVQQVARNHPHPDLPDRERGCA